MKNILIKYNNIISLENLHEAWREFLLSKKYRKDVSLFMLDLSHNIYRLHEDLKNKIYVHGPYQAFAVNDPKPRSIHKASVRDRLLHHAIYRALYPYFDSKFVFDSYSCRNGKGTHKALDRFLVFSCKVSKSNKQTCWVLKCDIRKFFASIDQPALIEILKKHICDPDIVWLVERVIGSFHSTAVGKGLPLGNLTSQLLVNIYMNEFDQHMKHRLKVKYYIRYADDFVIFSQDREWLVALIPQMQTFLSDILQLQLHPKKISIRTIASGVDYLGWVHFPDHRILRSATKRRMFRNMAERSEKIETVQSYLGLLKHGNTYKLQERIRSVFLEKKLHESA